jgi:hypothetical protein
MVMRVARSLGVLLTITVAAGITVAGPAPTLARPAGDEAAARDWVAPVRVVQGRFTGIDVVVDGDDRVHLVATGNGGVWYATDRSGTWTSTLILGDTGRFFYEQPTITLDARDRVFIAVLRHPYEVGDLGIWSVTDRGRARGTFPSTPTRLARPGNGSPSLRVDDAHLFLAAVDGWCCIGDGRVRLGTDATGSWTWTPVSDGSDPSLAIGSDGLPRLAFSSEGLSGPAGIVLATASSVAAGFSLSKVPGTRSRDGDPILALDGRDRAHVAWGGFGMKVQYARRSTAGWTPAATVSDGTGFVAFGFDLDSLGRPSVALAGSRVAVKVLSGGAWRESTIATSTDAREVVLSRALDGRVVVAWTDRKGVLVSRG